METETVKTVKHTPLPWAAKEEYEGWSIYKPDRGVGTLYIAKEIEQGYDMGKADAEFIVRACNSHYELLEVATKLYMQFYAGNSVSLEDAMNRASKDNKFEQEIIAVLKKATS